MYRPRWAKAEASVRKVTQSDTRGAIVKGRKDETSLFVSPAHHQFRWLKDVAFKRLNDTFSTQSFDPTDPQVKG